MPKTGAIQIALATVGVYLATGDPGVTITFPFAAAALWKGRGQWLKHLLAIYWTASAILALSQAFMATVVLCYTIFDLSIAGAALLVTMHDPKRYDARWIGGLSMMLMPAHLAMSATHGAANWLLYASILNAVFVLQSLILTGWLDGVGRGISGFLGRLRSIPVLRRED